MTIFARYVHVECVKRCLSLRLVFMKKAYNSRIKRSYNVFSYHKKRLNVLNRH